MRNRGTLAGGAALAVLLASAGAVQAAPTKVKPGFNIFSAQQDVEIGQQSAVQAERQLPILNDRNVESYVNRLVDELAPGAPGPKFEYRAKVVNASDINAFALPGGYLYVNRGLIDAARTEGELAGVVAHEMAHIGLRHGTHNASKAYATQAGLGVLGAVLSRGKPQSTAQIINIVGGLGLNAVFLKYSRDAETQADVAGAQMLARAGYDPLEMATFFDLLQQQKGGKQGGGAAQFFSDHPAPANRAARIRQEAQLIGAPQGTRRASGELQTVKTALRSAGPARSMQQIAQGQGRGQAPNSRRAPARGTAVRVAQPSSQFTSFQQRNDFFTIQHPENWRAYESQNGFGVTIVPEGGVVDAGDGQESIVYGVIVNHYDPFGEQNTNGNRAPRGGVRGGGSLDDATWDVVEQVRQSNTHLQPMSRALRRETVDGAEARSVVLSGRSPVTGQDERVTIFTRQLQDDHTLYSVFVAPAQDYAALSQTFSRMMQSLRVNDEAAHRID
jgi:Zn-dependent protease with chaperone function